MSAAGPLPRANPAVQSTQSNPVSWPIASRPSGWIDAHVHVWQEHEQIWVRNRVGALAGAFPIEQLESLARSHGITKVIVVQAAQTTQENQRCLQLCAQNSFVAGVVGWIDVLSSQVHCELDDLFRVPGLVGIRPLPANTFQSGWWRSKALWITLDALQHHGLAVDVLPMPDELDHIADAARAFPQLRIVLNHGGRPQLQCGRLDDWRRQMEPLGAYAHVYCKCSGLLERAGLEWTVQGVVPYIRVLLDVFGVDRVMFGSNWPVLQLAANYSTWFALVQDAAAALGLSRREIDAVMGRTASTCYALSRQDK